MLEWEKGMGLLVSALTCWIFSKDSTHNTNSILKLISPSGAHVLLDDDTDLGYVEDGAPCGPHMMCLDKKCLPIQSLNITSCPVGSTGKVCSGHGVSQQLSCSSSLCSDLMCEFSTWSIPKTRWSGNSNVRYRRRLPVCEAQISVYKAKSSNEFCNYIQSVVLITSKKELWHQLL